jgi:hypothetical protein
MVADAIRTGVWTPGLVEEALISAFRTWPGKAVYIDGNTMENVLGPDGAVKIVGAAAKFIGSRTIDYAYLIGWARCEAADRPFADHMRELGWSKATAWRGRRAAAEKLAHALNAEGIDPIVTIRGLTVKLRA